MKSDTSILDKKSISLYCRLCPKDNVIYLGDTLVGGLAHAVDGLLDWKSEQESDCEGISTLSTLGTADNNWKRLY